MLESHDGGRRRARSEENIVLPRPCDRSGRGNIKLGIEALYLFEIGVFIITFFFLGVTNVGRVGAHIPYQAHYQNQGRKRKARR